MPASWIPHLDGTLFVERCGEGRPFLVMPAAWGISHDFLQALLEPLELDSLYFDPLGVGLSSDLPAGWNPASILDEAESVRQWAEVDSLVLLGHASGAFLSLAYALDHPDETAGLVLFSPFAGYERANALGAPRVEARPGWTALQDRAAEIRRVPLTPEERTRAIFKEERAVDLYDDSEHYFEMAEAADRASFNPRMHDDEETDLLDDLHAITAPVLVISGLEDPITPIEEARLVATQLPSVRLVELPRCGHYPFVEARDRVREEIARFLEDVDLA